MNIKLQTNEQLSATVANGLAGVFVNGMSLSTSLNNATSACLTAVPSTYKTYADTVSSLSSDGYATQAQLDTKSAVSVDNEHADANILHISQEEYNQLVADDATLSNTMYVISSDYIEAYGQQIKNVAEPTELSDAANKQYVDNMASNCVLRSDLSGQTMPTSPTQNELAAAVKKLWQALGGSFA